MTRSISIVIPAFNEQARLPATVRRIQQYICASGWEFHEILIVDDGSTDQTAAVAESFAKASPRIRLLKNPGNRGKGYAVRNGMLAARGEWRLLTDADLSAPIEELEKLWAAACRGAAVAIGSRALDRSLIGVHQPGLRETAGKFFNAVMRVAIGLNIADTQCGFKLFRADVAEEIFARQRLERFGFDVEVLYIADLRGYKIAEIPVRWNHVEGSKVELVSGLHAFVELAQVRFNSVLGRYK